MFPFILLLLCTTASAFSCTCDERPTVKGAFASSALVFSGQVSEADIFSAKEVVPITRLKIGRVYKGDPPSSGTIDVAVGLVGSCGRDFGKDNVGTEWLFYIEPAKQTYRWDDEAWKYELSKEKYYFAHVCGRTRPIALANDDLAYLNEPEKYNGKTRLSGTIQNFGRYGSVEIYLRGNKQAVLATIDNSGYFEFVGFPPGRYRLDIVLEHKIFASRVIAGGYQELDISKIEKGTLHKVEFTFSEEQHQGIDIVLRREQ